MATFRNKRMSAAVWRETPENTRNNLSQNTLNLGMAEEYIIQVSEEIEGMVTKKLSQEFSRTESRILSALSNFNRFILNPQVWTCSVAVPGTSRSNNSENREPTGDRSLNDPFPEVVFSACRTSNLNDSDQEEAQYTNAISFLFFFLWSQYGNPVKLVRPINDYNGTLYGHSMFFMFLQKFLFDKKLSISYLHSFE